MNSIIRTMFRGATFGISAILTMGIFSYAAGALPGSPISGVPVGGLFMQYFNQMLVDSSVSTTGTVKNSAKTDQVATTTIGAISKWNGSKLIDAGGVYMDSSNKLIVSSLQVAGGNTNNVMISDSQGNVHWDSVDNIVSSSSGYSVVCAPAKYCITPQPSYPHAVFTTGVPTSTNQPWSKGASSCGYACQTGWTGADCNTSTVTNSVGRVFLSNISSNDLSHQNGTAYTDKQLYLIIDGVNQSNPPKGCAQLAGTTSCSIIGSFRDYSPSEWVTSTRIVSGGAAGIAPNTFPKGDYEYFFLYGTTITQVGYGKLLDPTPTSTPVNGVCNNGVQYACSVGTTGANVAGSCGGNSTWTCAGSNGGTTASCSKVNSVCAPTCGSSANTCGVGTPSGYSAGSCGGSQTWSCTNGTSTACSITNAACPQSPVVVCTDAGGCAQTIGSWAYLDGKSGGYTRRGIVACSKTTSHGNGADSTFTTYNSVDPRINVYTTDPVLTASKICEIQGRAYVSHTTQIIGLNCGSEYTLSYYHGTLGFTLANAPICYDTSDQVTGTSCDGVSNIYAGVNGTAEVINSITCSGGNASCNSGKCQVGVYTSSEWGSHPGWCTGAFGMTTYFRATKYSDGSLVVENYAYGYPWSPFCTMTAPTTGSASCTGYNDAGAEYLFTIDSSNTITASEVTPPSCSYNDR